MMPSYACFFCILREASALTNELPEESDQFRFLRAACLANLKKNKRVCWFNFGESIDHEESCTSRSLILVLRQLGREL